MAAIALVGKMGAEHYQLRYSDDPKPVVWMVDAKWGHGHHAAGGMTPTEATLRLLDDIVDGGQCMHCRKPTSVLHDFRSNLPELMPNVCWYVYDPEVKVYRRTCEAERPGHIKVSRNGPCPCGSGKKFKRCHG